MTPLGSRAGKIIEGPADEVMDSFIVRIAVTVKTHFKMATYLYAGAEDDPFCLG
jgi:hypothetical protein